MQPTATGRSERDEALGAKHPGVMCFEDWVLVSEGTVGGASGASIGLVYPCIPREGPIQVTVEPVGHTFTPPL